MEQVCQFYGILHYLLLCMFLFSCISTMVVASSMGNETDRLSLVAFRERITQDPLDIMGSWNDSVHFCEWQGVSCSKRHYGRVSILDLEGKKLGGTLPPHIGNLSFLSMISLNHGFFQGEIPPEIGHLSRLRYLSLRNNAFHGKIPSSLSNCSNLRVIDLSYNKLFGEIPFELSYLLSKNLTQLILKVNNLTGSIPVWLGNSTSLKILDLDDNGFQGTIPSGFGRLSNLWALLINSNNISGTVPPSIYNLSSLQWLNIGFNQLYGRIPSDVGSTLPNLSYLNVGRNHFNGLLPRSLSNASKLFDLEFYANHFTGAVPPNLGSLKDLRGLSLSRNNLENEEDTGFNFLTSLTNCSKLQFLDISTNMFRGELPSSIANFSDSLTIFSASENNISGSIPEGIGALIGLQYLLLHRNDIKGKIPTGIGRLQSLGYFYLNENRISGAIPSSIGNITQLLRVELQSNDLEGNIPNSFGNCQQLEHLRLDENKLTGELPKEIASLSSIIILYLTHNFLLGLLPPEIGNMTKLVELAVTGNRLSGEIPSQIGRCEMLEQLYLAGNSFEGGIPSTFSNLKSIKAIDLSSNNLSGSFPAYFQNLTLLKHLNLSYNNLEGEVPQEGIFRNQSEFSIIGNGKLCGGLKSLGFPACQVHIAERKGLPLVLKIVIPTVISCSFLIASLYLIFRRRKKPRASSSFNNFVDKKLPKVSHSELSQATNGFSSPNLIGQGAHGSVYKGILNNDGVPVAVKVFNLRQKGASKSFMAECMALKNIRHRNLVKIITVCSSIDFKGDDFKALVFELMPNGSLDEWLHHRESSQPGRENLSLIQRISIAADMGAALEYLHYGSGTPIIHGDLKPSNILLDHEMTAHVGDFGLARVLSTYQNDNSPQNPTSSTGLKGTVGYMAPEHGIGGRLSLEGDLYSFGIMLLEMLTGKRPTDDLFTNGMDLRQYVKMALPEHVNEILEPSILSSVEGNCYDEINIHSCATESEQIVKCAASILKIGISCSMGSPAERMSIKDAVIEINRVKHKYID